jgi:hypothetical protein
MTIERSLGCRKLLIGINISIELSLAWRVMLVWGNISTHCKSGIIITLDREVLARRLGRTWKSVLLQALQVLPEVLLQICIYVFYVFL